MMFYCLLLAIIIITPIIKSLPLNTNDASAFQALSQSLDRENWRDCNKTEGDVCLACSENTDDHSILCEDSVTEKRIVGLRFRNLGVYGTVPVSALNSLTALRIIDFSSFLNRSYGNALVLPVGESCLSIGTCLKADSYCNFGVIAPICPPSSAPTQAPETINAIIIGGSVGGAIGLLLLCIILFVCYQNRKARLKREKKAKQKSKAKKLAKKMSSASFHGSQSSAFPQTMEVGPVVTQIHNDPFPPRQFSSSGVSSPSGRRLSSSGRRLSASGKNLKSIGSTRQLASAGSKSQLAKAKSRSQLVKSKSSAKMIQQSEIVTRKAPSDAASRDPSSSASPGKKFSTIRTRQRSIAKKKRAESSMDWNQETDVTSGRPVWVNASSGERTFTSPFPPSSVPPGMSNNNNGGPWEEIYDAASNSVVWVNKQTGQYSWTSPY